MYISIQSWLIISGSGCQEPFARSILSEYVEGRNYVPSHPLDEQSVSGEQRGCMRDTGYGFDRRLQLLAALVNGE